MDPLFVVRSRDEISPWVESSDLAGVLRLVEAALLAGEAVNVEPVIVTGTLVVPPPPVKYLPAIVDDGPCDGGHGRFCPECASINRRRA